MMQILDLSKYCLTEDGIAEILEEIQFYFEEFDKDKERTDPFSKYKLGEKDKVFYLCRCYCSHNGKPINRLNVRIYTSIGELDKSSLKVFNKYLEKETKHFEKISNRRNSVLRQVFRDYLLENNTYNKLREVYPSIRNELLNMNEFEWKDFVNVSTKYLPEFNTDLFLKSGRSFRKWEEYTEITIRFDSTNYKVKGGKSIFDNIVVFEMGDNFHALPTE